MRDASTANSREISDAVENGKKRLAELVQGSAVISSEKS